MNAACAVTAFALLALGCTVTVERVGSAVLQEPGRWPVVGSRAESIVEALGVPDEIRPGERGFHLVYHFVDRSAGRFALGAFGLKLVSDERVRQRGGSLELFFDEAGRLATSRLRHPSHEPGE